MLFRSSSGTGCRQGCAGPSEEDAVGGSRVPGACGSTSSASTCLAQATIWRMIKIGYTMTEQAAPGSWSKRAQCLPRGLRQGLRPAKAVHDLPGSARRGDRPARPASIQRQCGRGLAAFTTISPFTQAFFKTLSLHRTPMASRLLNRIRDGRILKQESGPHPGPGSLDLPAGALGWFRHRDATHHGLAALTAIGETGGSGSRLGPRIGPNIYQGPQSDPSD